MSEIAVVATIIAKPGMEDKLLEQVGTIVGPTRLEAGALQYDLHRDRDDPRRFVFFERWESEAALAAHARAYPGLPEGRGGLHRQRGDPRDAADRLKAGSSGAARCRPLSM